MVNGTHNLAAYNAARRDGFVSSRAVWAYVSSHPGATTQEIADAVGLSKTACYHHLRRLLKTGVLAATYLPSGERVARSLHAPVPLLIEKGSLRVENLEI